ncbi:MAG: DNA-3-methyladenine glycosylase family protein [Actinomycetota bacterium]
MSWDIPLRGPAGEPVDLRRTLASHGVASLPPMLLDEESYERLEVTVPLSGARPRTVTVTPGRKGHAKVEIKGRPPGATPPQSLLVTIRHVLNLEEDLSPFYEVAAEDPELAWVSRGAGRMIRSPSVFEEVVKTVCTTNCSWALTTKMVTALVEHLGEPATGAPKEGWRGRAFPTPEAMAASPERFYRDVVRAGYRGPYLRTLARMVAAGEVDLERLGERDNGLSDDEVEEKLIALPGVGPYAAAHIGLMLGRYSRLILDSWTRPKYARLRGSRRPVSDAAIVRRFRPYGRYAGLAFCCYLTWDWVEEAG